MPKKKNELSQAEQSKRFREKARRRERRRDAGVATVRLACLLAVIVAVLARYYWS